MEAFMIRAWDFILSGWRWLYEPRVGVCIPFVAGYRTGRDTVFAPQLVGSCRFMEGFLIRAWELILRGWRWLYEPRVEVSTSCVAVSTRGATVFVRGIMFQSYMHPVLHRPQKNVISPIFFTNLRLEAPLPADFSCTFRHSATTSATLLIRNLHHPAMDS